MAITVIGGTHPFQRKIRATVALYPEWYVRGARVSRFEVSADPAVRDQIAMYRHGSRDVLVYPGVGDLLTKAIGHELAHGCDDNFDSPHCFSSSATWKDIHAKQQYFDLPKYRDSALEYFADMVVKTFLVGADKMRLTNPDEVRYIELVVFPILKKEFGA